MKLQIKANPAIEDARRHPRETVERLRRLLAEGACARPDPRRQNFYEVQDGPVVFYIYVSPATSKVHLLATWGADHAAACA